MDPDGLARARVRLRDFLANDRSYQALADDIQLIRTGATVLDRHLAGISDLLHLLVEIAVAAESSGGGSPRVSLDAVARYIDLPALFGHEHFVPQQPRGKLPEIVGRPSLSRPLPEYDDHTERKAMLQAIGESLALHRASLSEDATPAGSTSGRDGGDHSPWERWAALLLAYAKGSKHLAHPPYFNDMATMAAGLPPGILFRRDLERMTVAEWSRLYLRGFPPGRHAVPSWVCVVGLWGLGFGRDLLEQAASLGAPDGAPLDLLLALGASATLGDIRGLVLVMSDDADSLGERSERRPEEYGHPAECKIIAIYQHELEVYSKALAWLAEREALEGLVYEQ